jgi:hypothetical protein
MSSEKELLIGYLTKVHNKTEDEVNALIYDADGNIVENAFDNVLMLDSARVSTFKAKEKTMFDQGHKKGTAETAKDFQAKFREATGFETDAETFEELVALYQADVTEKSKGKKQEITADFIRTHPEYLKLEKERVPKTEYEKVLSEYEQFKKSVEYDKTFSSISARASSILEESDPYFPDGTPQVVKDNLRQVYINAMRKYEWQSDGNGKYIAVKDGVRVEDGHGNPLMLDDIARAEVANYFVPKKQPARDSVSNKQADPSNQSQQIGVFKTKSEYNKLMNNATPQERVALLKKFKEVNGNELPE